VYLTQFAVFFYNVGSIRASEQFSLLRSVSFLNDGDGDDDDDSNNNNNNNNNNSYSMDRLFTTFWMKKIKKGF
jgi:hypothetical protein